MTPTDIIAGTITLTNGSTAFVGVGTSWTEDDLRSGDLFVFIEGGESFAPPIIDTITDNLNGTLIEPWAGPTLTGVRYRARYQWDSSRVSAQARNMIQKLGNGNVEALAALTGPGLPVFNGPHTIIIKPETDFINGVAFNVQVDTLSDRDAYDGQSTGFAVLVADVGDGRSAVYSKNSNTSGDWSNPAYVTGPVGPSPVIEATITQTAPGTAPDVDVTPIMGGYSLDFDLPLSRGSGFQFEFATATVDANPGAGNWRANNTAFASATQLFISKTSDVGADVAAFLAAMGTSTSPNKGTLVFQRLSDGVTASWIVTGVTDATGYVKVAVSNYSGPSVFDADDISMLQFMKSGNAGAGTGDVVGPSSSVDSELALMDGISGKLLKGGGLIGASVGLVRRGFFQHRLTLASGVPVMGATSYVSQTTLYLTPYLGNVVSLYNGTAWVELYLSEISVSLSGTAADTVYDVFLNYNSGTPQLVLTAWTNDTTRATALARQNGNLVKSGTPTQLYVGTIRTFNAGQCDWSVAGSGNGGALSRLYVWNMFNRVSAFASNKDTTSSWTYASGTIRAMNNSILNSIRWVQGLAEDRFFAIQNLLAATSGPVASIGIGLNRTNARDNASNELYHNISGAPTLQLGLVSTLLGFGGLGHNYVCPVEAAPQNVSVTFFASGYHLFQFSLDM